MERGTKFSYSEEQSINFTHELLAKSNLVTVMPLTANKGNKMVDDIEIMSDSLNHLPLDSIIKVYDVESFDYSRFIKKIGVANDEIMDKVKIYLKKHFDI